MHALLLDTRTAVPDQMDNTAVIIISIYLSAPHTDRADQIDSAKPPSISTHPRVLDNVTGRRAAMSNIGGMCVGVSGKGC